MLPGVNTPAVVAITLTVSTHCGDVAKVDTTGEDLVNWTDLTNMFLLFMMLNNK